MGNYPELSLHSQLLVYLPWKCDPALTKLFLFFSFIYLEEIGRYAYGCIELFHGQKLYSRSLLFLSINQLNNYVSVFAYSSSFASIRKLLFMDAYYDKGSWLFTPPIIGISFMLMAWVPKH